MEDTNVFNGVVIKYSEPPEAKKPKKRWRFYVFKVEITLLVIETHKQTKFLSFSRATSPFPFSTSTDNLLFS